MASALPDDETLEVALGMAVRAPSVHNTQPWRWRVAADRLELYADTDRHLPCTDPVQRALVVSCGAALHHMRVALAGLGWTATVTRLPDPDRPELLATITTTPRPPTDTDIELTAAILLRQSDRRRYAAIDVPHGYIRTVSRRANRFGAAVRHVPPVLRARLAGSIRCAASRHAEDPAYLRELVAWSGRHDSPDGVPARNTPPARPGDELPSRAFADPCLADADASTDAAEWLVVCTAGDDRRFQLSAGEATSELLLTATDLGLSTCIQTEPLGMPDLRRDIREAVLHDCAFPQTMVRLGWVPANSAPLPTTPRRAIGDVLDH
ncbi:Acg family FMN-binding oxidoreductase [Nocardia sp. N2S4-5]|uniref:Acg family FMN-binding oxidoreductase n=1 Tax=Nocardia sp. N2S4-5 TaxID=3351565 RepID=UPI0037CFA08C